MVKSLLLSLLFPVLPLFSTAPKMQFDYKSCLEVELNERGNYTLTGIKGFSGSEFRLYRYEDQLIDEVSNDAFLNTNFSSLVLTNAVKYIDELAFENAPSINRLKYTGSELEFQALELTSEFQNGISYYSCDEGFINYWNENIRPNENSNICDITQATFSEVYSLYKSLSNEDLEIVDSYVDLANAKISDSMKELISVFTKTPNAPKNTEWNQTGAITLIMIIAVIGMTSITVFFLLKTKNIIK